MKAQKQRYKGLSVDFTDAAVVAEITAWLEQAGVESFEIETKDRRIYIALSADGRPEPLDPVQARKLSPPAAAASSIAVKSPFAGHFHAAHPARAQAAAPAGSVVAASDIVGFVKVGPMLIAAQAPQAGTVSRHIVQNGNLVGYGDHLLVIGQN